MSDAVVAYLLLGSNIGDRAAYLQQAQKALMATAGELVAAWCWLRLPKTRASRPWRRGRP